MLLISKNSEELMITAIFDIYDPLEEELNEEEEFSKKRSQYLLFLVYLFDKIIFLNSNSLYTRDIYLLKNYYFIQNLTLKLCINNKSAVNKNINLYTNPPQSLNKNILSITNDSYNSTNTDTIKKYCPTNSSTKQHTEKINLKIKSWIEGL